MAKFDKTTLIGEIMQFDAENDTFVTGILMSMGMHCIGCHVAPTESLEEACMVHGIEPEIMINAINEYLENLELSKAD